MLQTITYAYLTVINVIAFIVYGVDKRRAIRGDWRIPEKVLLTLTAVGGSVGALFGMYTFRHKTRKPRFAYGVPVMLAVHLLLFYMIFIWY